MLNSRIVMSSKESDLVLFPLVPITECCSHAESFASGKFSDIVSSFFSNTFHQDSVLLPNACNAANFSEFLESSINEFFTNICCYHNLSEYDILVFGVSSLYCFIQLNWTGPTQSSISDSVLENLLKNIEVNETNLFNEIKTNIISHLSTNDDSISCSACEPVLLFLAELVFRWCPTLPSKKWWLLRSLYIHQLLLSDPSPIIHKELMSLIDELDEEVTSFSSPTLNTIFQLEKIQIHLHLYSEITKAQSFIDTLLGNLKFKPNLVGKLGKRTKFQERDIAQLTLSVNPDVQAATNLKYHCCSFPKDQKLDDDIRLPNIEFIEESDNSSLDGIQQASLLAIFVLTKKNKPTDRLQIEELSPYLTYLLSDPKVWSFQLTALLFRSLLEGESSRTIERSINQIQSLITDLESAEPPFIDRLPFIFCSYASPKWKFEAHLAKLLLEVGAVRSALDIYKHLQMWEEIVTCYNYLKLKHKAAAVIRQEMAKQETVQLWCLLGDATDDETCYQKAWELSNCKSSKAQKHWALYYFSRKQYAESIDHLQKSLELNSLQVSLWFNLGFAALIEEKWELSASAFRRYCSLEPDSFEAWNNLAKAYIKIGQKNRAWKALQEAVKCNYDNWKVWDNLMAVSTDCGDFHEVIKCYHRILDLKGKHVDLEVLRIMVDVLSCNSIGEDVVALKKQACKLFGRLTSSVLNESHLWRLYAALTRSFDEDDPDKFRKIFEYLQRAQRTAAGETNWDLYINRCKDMTKLCLDLCEAQKQFSEHVSQGEGIHQLNSIKLVLKGVITKIKKSQTDVLGELNSELTKEVQSLTDELDIIENTLRRQIST